MSVELETEINVKEKIKEVVQDPGKYKVIFANDNETPMDFVVEFTSWISLDIVCRNC